MSKGSRKSQEGEAVRRIGPAVQSVRVGSVELEVRASLRDVLLSGGLAVAMALFDEEAEKLCGPRYSRGEGQADRWGPLTGGGGARGPESEV